MRDSEGKPDAEIGLKYYAGSPVIERLDRVSRPGLRIYRGANDILNVIVSTQHRYEAEPMFLNQVDASVSAAPSGINLNS